MVESGKGPISAQARPSTACCLFSSIWRGNWRRHHQISRGREGIVDTDRAIDQGAREPQAGRAGGKRNVQTPKKTVKTFPCPREATICVCCLPIHSGRHFKSCGRSGDVSRGSHRRKVKTHGMCKMRRMQGSVCGKQVSGTRCGGVGMFIYFTS